MEGRKEGRVLEGGRLNGSGRRVKCGVRGGKGGKGGGVEKRKRARGRSAWVETKEVGHYMLPYIQDEILELVNETLLVRRCSSVIT